MLNRKNNKMEELLREKTEDTPYVELLPSGKITFKERSLPEDSNSFFAPIFDWVSEYVKNPQEETEIIFQLEYFNSASARKFVKILIEFEPLFDNGKNVKVIWLYKQGDIVIRDRGIEISKVISLPFEVKEI